MAGEEDCLPRGLLVPQRLLLQQLQALRGAEAAVRRAAVQEHVAGLPVQVESLGLPVGPERTATARAFVRGNAWNMERQRHQGMERCLGSPKEEKQRNPVNGWAAPMGDPEQGSVRGRCTKGASEIQLGSWPIVSPAAELAFNAGISKIYLLVGTLAGSGSKFIAIACSEVPLTLRVKQTAEDSEHKATPSDAFW